jgi:hypothetical protein
MRTFKKVKAFGTGTGYTGGKSNEAILFQNAQTLATSVTIQSLTPQGSIQYVGPFSISANQNFIYPIFAYGWTASASIRAYELF